MLGAERGVAGVAGVAVNLDWAAIAERLRGLIHVQNRNDLESVARRLGVDERSLKASVEGRRPTLNVMAALIRTYGLDPSWVLTGDYDPQTHRHALQSNTQEIEVAMKRMLLSAPVGPLPQPKPGDRRAG